MSYIITEKSILNPYKYLGKVTTEDGISGYSISQILYAYKYSKSDRYKEFTASKKYKLFTKYLSEQTKENETDGWDTDFASQYIIEAVNLFTDNFEGYYEEVVKLSKYDDVPELDIEDIDKDLVRIYPELLYDLAMQFKEEESEEESDSEDSSSVYEDSSVVEEVSDNIYFNMTKLKNNIPVMEDDNKYIIYLITPQIQGEFKKSKRIYRNISVMKNLPKYTERQDKIMMEGTIGARKADILTTPLENEYDKNFRVFEEIEPKLNYRQLYYRVTHSGYEFLNDEYGYSSILLTTRRKDLKVREFIKEYSRSN